MLELVGLTYRPAPVEAVPVIEDGAAVSLAPDAPFRVLSWNIQFAGTRRQQFFYDGGEAVHVPEADLERGLSGVAAVLRAAAPDIALLQEVDRASTRTHSVDELTALLAREPFPVWASAPYHRCRYVPVPPRDPLGKVELHLAILSRFRQRAALRIQLPLLAEPRLRQALNLKRCLLTSTIPIRGWDAPLHVAVTHLSAFSRGDGTLPRQVAVLAEWMHAREQAGEPFVLGGDLNLLPPGDDPARLPDAAEYADRPNPISVLVPRFRSIVPVGRMLSPENATYLPWGATGPDRLLDYLFVSDGIEVLSAGPPVRGAGPVPGEEPISDHLPLLASLCLRHPPRKG